MKLGPSGTSYTTSEKTLSASFEVSKLIAQSKKAHTIAETLIKPCILKVAEELLGQEAQKKIREIPLSNDTVKSRIQKMSTDIEEQVIDKIKKVLILHYNVMNLPIFRNVVNYLYLFDFWRTIKRLKKSFYFLKNLKRRRKVQML